MFFKIIWIAYKMGLALPSSMFVYMVALAPEIYALACPAKHDSEIFFDLPFFGISAELLKKMKRKQTPFES